MFRPIFPVPKSTICFVLIAATFSSRKRTEANETDVAPEEISVSVFIRFDAWITEFIKGSRNGLLRPKFFALLKPCLTWDMISKSPRIWLSSPVPTLNKCSTASAFSFI